MPLIGSRGAGSIRSFGLLSGVLNTLPVNTVLPVISGTVSIGQTLSVSTGTWTGIPTPTFSYQWQRGTTNISGATNSTYAITSGDYNNTLRCVVTATNIVGSVSATSSSTVTVPAQAPINTSAPTISGSASRGGTLTLTSVGSWVGTPSPSYSYQWQRNGSDISGATSNSYSIQDADYNTTIRCVVVATNAGGTSSAASSSTGTVPGIFPSFTSTPYLWYPYGTPVYSNHVIYTSFGYDGFPSPSAPHTWYRGGSVNPTWTGGVYITDDNDIGNRIDVNIVLTNAVGSTSYFLTGPVVQGQPPVNTSLPTISGTVSVGSTLSVTTGSWSNSPTSYSYQWQRGTTNISGATGSTYTIQSADAGNTIRCVVTASNSWGSSQATTSDTSTVPAPVSGSQTFNYVSNADQTFTVPAGVTAIRVKMWGGGGGSNRDAGSGGGGGYSDGTIAVTPGESLIVRVARGGQGGGQSDNETTSGSSSATRLNGGAGGWPGGGTGGSVSSYGAGGGGGGYTGIFRGSNPLIIAGGGGGGGDDASAQAGGGSTGVSASGGGGTQTSGGSSASTPNIGAAYLQGAGGGSSSIGGGGGGGYYGGGAGYIWGGGGGGSGFIGGSGVTNAQTLQGSGTTPGNSGDGSRGTAGNGAPAGGTGESSSSIRLGLKGRNGLMLISWPP